MITEASARKLRAGLIVDSESIDNWQFTAIINCRDLIDITTIIFCENSVSTKRPIKYGFYYLLNLVSIRNRQTKAREWSSLVDTSCQVIKFNCTQSANWQTIAEATKQTVARQELDLIVKFGMNLLKDPHTLRAKFGVLSFHHGDPAVFRGRPAGFYEHAQNVGEIGAVVQELSNKLDAGKMRATGRYQIVAHSYRQTLESLYAHSAMLLRHAILNCIDDKTIDIKTTGKNNHLPSNSAVLKFVMRLSWQKLNHLRFGLFQRRMWQIAEIKPLALQNFAPITQPQILKSLQKPRGLGFVADPFILPNGQIICEATQKNSQKGFLLALQNGQHTRIDTTSLGSNHLSFPFVIQHEDQVFIMPEMAENGPQLICELDTSLKIQKAHLLIGLEHERLIDPVVLFRKKVWWLFAGRSGSEADHLFLWSSENLFGPYTPHRLNPIVVDPARARNAGAFIESNGQLFRLGQDNRRNYGDGITLCRVSQLDYEGYEEIPVTQLKIAGLQGPHTLSSNGTNTYIDFYQTGLDPIAWLSRLKSKI